MSKWLTSLVQAYQEIWREINGSNTYRNIAGLFGILGAGFSAIKYIKPEFGAKIHALPLGSALTWQSWAIGFLILVSIATADGARRLLEKQKKDHLTTIEPTLQAQTRMTLAQQNVEEHPEEFPDYTYREAGDGDLQVATVKISNTIHDVNFKVADIESVKAQIFYRELDGTEAHDVKRGVWLDTTLTWIDCRIGQPKSVIIAVKTGDGTAYAVQADYRDMDIHPDESFEPTHRVLKGNSYRIMLQLIAGDERSGRLVGRFRYRLTVRPHFQIEQID